MQIPSAREPVTESPEEPLPQTLRFVLVLGALITIGWFLMFLLLQSRW